MKKKLLILVVLLLVNVPAFAESVDTAWVRIYHSPVNMNEARAIDVDHSGNIYVTGFSSGGEPYYNYATIKYYPNGDTVWVKRYNGDISWYDDACAIAVDRINNVYVTGGSYGSGTSYDYTTVKYYSNGDSAWVRRYNGPGNDDDEVYGIAIDGSDNVLVTGYSWGNGTGPDYATIKYYPNGDTAWVRRYHRGESSADRAYAIAVDELNNIYVTGRSTGSLTDYDYTTIKYYPNGDTAWVRIYDGIGSSVDEAHAIAVDDSGNIYVTGWSDQTTGEIKPNYDYATIKYYPNGDTAWVRRYNGPGNRDDDARAIAIDHSGNVYVTGYSTGSGTDEDYATIKYFPNGDTAWVRRYNGPGNGDDEPNAMTIDDSGNVYITGTSFEGSGTERYYATIKYYTNGDSAWSIRYNVPGAAYGIAMDGSGSVYVTGESDGYTTIKYVQTPSGVKDETASREKPSEFALSQNYPNPFNPTTKIEFTLSKSGSVNLNIYDILGRKVRTLVSENWLSGYKSVFWDGKNDAGKDVTSGIYFYQLRRGDFSEAKKMLLLK